MKGQMPAVNVPGATQRLSAGSKNLFKVFLELHKCLAGMGCKAQRAVNSPCYWQAV